MKKRHNTIGIEALLFTLIICLTACGTKKQENGTHIVQPEAQIESGQEQAPAETSTEQEAGTISVELKEAYQTALKNLMETYTMPDGTECGYDLVSDMANNKFAIFDIDQDGTEELVVIYATTYVAGQIQGIYNYDSATRQFVTELTEYPMLTFYDNGIVKAEWSHNQGLSGDFWPYTLYQYDATTDSYQKIGIVDAWDKNYFDKDFDGNAFPEDIDVSRTGLVYYIMTDTTDEVADPVDVTVYEEWYQDYLAGAEEITIPCMDLTAENIAGIE